MRENREPARTPSYTFCDAFCRLRMFSFWPYHLNTPQERVSEVVRAKPVFGLSLKGKRRNKYTWMFRGCFEALKSSKANGKLCYEVDRMEKDVNG